MDIVEYQAISLVTGFSYRYKVRGLINIGKVGESRYRFTKTNNIKKLERERKFIQRRLLDIRLNHIYQTTTAIVKTKHCRIIVEDLNIKGMIKSQHSITN